MSWIQWLLVIAALLALAVLGAGQLGMLQGRPPRGLGVADGRLKPPSATPNSVSSQAALHPDHPMREHAQIEALPLGDSAAQTMARLRSIVESMPGARVVESRDDYLYAQFTSRVMRFVDDVEFWADTASHVVHVRSASRVGRRDFDVNRQRIEAIRQRLRT